MKALYYVGIDIASASFVASIVTAKAKQVGQPRSFVNGATGFTELLDWLAKAGLESGNSVLCLEATGVYSEELSYWFTAQQWRVAVIPPQEIKRAAPPHGAKSDNLDSRHIGEYGARYWDQLHRFEPRPELLEQVRVLLQLREQYVQQKTAHQNASQALERKVVRTPLAEQLLAESVAQLQQHIKTIEAEIRRLFDQDPDLRQQLILLMTIPGVGLLLASHMLCLAATLRTPHNPKVVAAHLGLAPLPHQSGTSVWRPAASRGFGPSTMRKLLHLAARSQRFHHPPARAYFERKSLAGKPKKLILNNLANQIVRVMCALLRSRRPYSSQWVSLPPQGVSLSLTKS